MTENANTELFLNPMAEARGVHFSFSSRKIYSDLNLIIPRGKVTVIMGPSGCGKSTFLSLLGGRLKPSAGEVCFDGERVDQMSISELYSARKKMGMLFQSSALLTDLDVFDNVAFPYREQTDLPEEIIRILVLMKLEMVGLRGARDLMPSQLSGGMTRRVALARAIALDPAMIMYDEPFVGLDPISMGVVVELIRKLNDAMDLTSVIVTHDVAEGCSIADYAYLIDNGKVAGHGTPRELRESEDPAIFQFINGRPDGPVGYHYPAMDIAKDLENRS